MKEDHILIDRWTERETVYVSSSMKKSLNKVTGEGGALNLK